jgi:hypothetical protein
VAIQCFGLLAAVIVAACGGRSIGGPGPSSDGGPGPGPDVGWPNDPPDAATCEHSPLQGVWDGTFSGEVASPVTGVLPVEGTITLEIYCTDMLLVTGEMSGFEQGGYAFDAVVTGEYDEAQSAMRATFEGWVESIPTTGTLRGMTREGDVDHLDGTWEGVAPSVQGTGSGHWGVVLF